MTAVAAAVTELKLVTRGPEAMKRGRGFVLDKEDIKKEFMTFCEEYKLPPQLKEKIYKALVDKICNPRFGAIMKVHKEKTTGRKGTKRADQAVRTKLKATTGNKKQKKNDNN